MPMQKTQKNVYIWKYFIFVEHITIIKVPMAQKVQSILQICFIYNVPYINAYLIFLEENTKYA